MGSFKQLKSSDVITVPVIANKTWNFNYCPIPSTDPYISVYNGTNYTNSFDPGNEPTTNTHYDRLTYKQINQLFYHQYSGSLNTASLASSIHYLSASSQHPSASFFNFNNDPAFISYFPTGANETIRVIQISPDAYGNRVLPYSFQMSSSQYSFYDDGKGNVFDSFSGPTPIHVGNIFYSEGTVVITSQAYQNAFVLPAVAYDDVYNIVRNDYPNPATFSFYPLLNDDLRGNTLVNNSIQIFGGDASFFSTGSNNSVSLSFSGLGVGTYQTFYTFLTTGSYCAALMSSTASITINVADPECEFEIGIIIPPPYPPTPSVTPTATPGITVTPSISVSPTVSVSPSKTPSVTPTATISVTPSLTPTPSVSTGFEFRDAKSCCDGSAQVIALPTAFGAGYYAATNGLCYTAGAIAVSGPATVTWDGGTLYADCATCQATNPCPTPTPTPTISLTATPTPTISISATPSVTPTISISRTPSVTPTISISATPSVTPTISISRTPSTTPTISISATPSVTPTISISATPSVTPTSTATPSISISKTPSVTPSISISATPSLTPTLTPTLSITPSPTATFPACAVILNSVTYVGSTNWVYNWTAGTSCSTILTEYSNDGITWGSNAGGCISPRTTSIGGISGTLYFRITMFCNIGGPVTSNVIIVNNVSATPTPTISLTPTPTRTISVTPTVTPTISVSKTPSVTPSPSSPSGTVTLFQYGANKAAACSEFAPTAYYCLTGDTDLCTATGLLDSDGIDCFGNSSTINVSDGFNVRLWNGTSFGSCQTCL
jgi:hypothetical protein